MIGMSVYTEDISYTELGHFIVNCNDYLGIYFVYSLVISYVRRRDSRKTRERAASPAVTQMAQWHPANSHMLCACR